jgi:hypothetical protein
MSAYIAAWKKWKEVFSSVDHSELGAMCAALSGRIIIVNWFERGALEKVLGCAVSPEKYAEFLAFLKMNPLDDPIAGDARCLWDVMNRDNEGEAGSEG